MANTPIKFLCPRCKGSTIDPNNDLIPMDCICIKCKGQKYIDIVEQLMPPHKESINEYFNLSR